MKLRKRKHQAGKKRKRSVALETLEGRRLLFSDFTNDLLPLDTNSDGKVTLIDALVSLNDVGRGGTRTLDPAIDPVDKKVDANGDGRISTLDPLVILNALGLDVSPPDVNFALANDTAPDGTNNDLLSFDPTITGTVTDRVGITSLEVRIDGAEALDVAFDRDGNFTFDPFDTGNGIADGEHTLSVTSTDAKGQVSDPKELTFTLDTSAPVGDVNLDPSSDTGVVGDRLTSRQTVSVLGQTEPNAVVRINGVSAAAQSDDTGAFTIDDVAIADGINTFEINIIDAAGNAGDSTSSLVRVDSDDAFGLLEDNTFTVSQSVDVDLGTDGDRRQLRVEFDESFDLTDQEALLRDVLNVFLVDAADETITLLDAGTPGTPVFSQDENGARFVAGISSLQSGDLIVDVSKVAGGDGKLVFQLISGDTDRQGLTVVDRITSEPLAAEKIAFDEQSTQQSPVAPAGPVDLGSVSSNGSIEVQLARPRLNVETGKFETLLLLTNRGAAIGRELAIALRNLPDAVSVEGSQTSDGDTPLLNLRDAVPRGGLAPGQSTAPILLTFVNPGDAPILLDIDVLSGGPNLAPVLAPVDAIATVPGDVVVVELEGSDEDNDPLTFSIVPGTDSLPTLRLSADGVLTIRPEPDQVGQFEFEVQVSDGAATSRQTVRVDISADPVTTTRVSGIVLDTERNPIPGITTNIGSTAVLTDAQGRFTIEAPAGGFDGDALDIHGEEFGGPQVFPFVAEKLPLLFEGGRDLFDGVNNVIDRAIYLPALDVAGGTVVDPVVDIEVTQEIAAGETASVSVRAGTLNDQQGNPFTGVLSITEVPRDLTPAALPPGAFPGTVVTIQPGEMAFTQPAPLTLPNRGGFAPGTEMDLYSINPTTGQFDDVGTGVVSADGTSIETVEGGIRNSSWHFFTPTPSPEQNDARDAGENQRNQEELCEDCEGKAKTAAGKNVGTSEIELHSGALREFHDLATYRSLDQVRGVQLQYNSVRADPRPIVHFDVLNAVGDFLVVTASVKTGDATVEVPGAAAGGQFALAGGEHFWEILNDGDDISAALQIDLSDQPTGVYDIQIQHGVRQFNGEIFTGLARESNIPVAVVNSIASPFGAGWELAGFHQIIELTNGDVMLVTGEGDQYRFTAPAVDGQPFQSPAGDFTTLVKQNDGTYVRTTPEQMVYQFNDRNQLESMTDRNGNATAFTFDGRGRLSGWVDPVGLETEFVYDGDLVDQIIDPQGRITRLEHDESGNLLRITDPDDTSRQFQYDQSHRMVTEINKRGFEESVSYGFHGRVVSVTRKDGSRGTFAPAQIQGLAQPQLTSDPLSAPAAFSGVITAQAQFSDPNGNVSAVDLDQAGQVREVADDEGQAGRIIRNADNLPVTVTDGRGNGVFFEYDEFGNPTISGQTGFQRPDSFLPHRATEISGGVVHLASADLDADGDIDAVAITDTDRIVVLVNDAGQLNPQASIAAGFDDASDIVLADINGDSIPDILVPRDGGLSILAGVGDATFGNSQNIAVTDTLGGVAVSDLDSDGLADIAIARDGNTSIAVLIADGIGGFALNEVEVGGNSLDLVAGDFTGDGLNDLVVGTTSSLLLLAGSQDGSLGTPERFSNLSANYFQVTAGDLNRDGVLDIAAASRNLTHAAINDGQGEFTVEDLTTGTGNREAREVVIADHDRDGFDEIFVLEQNASTFTMLSNLGNGDFDVDAMQQLSTGARAEALTIADFNQDGDIDVLVGNAARRNGSNLFGGGITLVEGGIGQIFFHETIDVGPTLQVQSVELADVTQDGIVDAILVSTDPENDRAVIAISAGAGDATFSGSPTIIADDLPELADVITGDFNGDGIEDIATLGLLDAQINLLLGNVGGTFTAANNFDFDGRGAQIESADLNDDGIDDLVATLSSPRRVVTLISDAVTGEFTAAETEANFSHASGSNSLSIVDLNGDSIADVLGVTPNRSFALDNAIAMFGIGDGTFSAPREFGSGVDATAAAATDVNGDDLADIVVIGKGLSVRLAQPDGSFAAPQVTPVNNDVRGVGIVSTDFNGDGNIDFMTLDTVDEQWIVYLGDGNGNFADPVAFAAGEDAQTFGVADIDFDGDIDPVLVTGAGVMVGRNFMHADCGAGNCMQRTTYDPLFSQPIREVNENGHVALFEIDPSNGNTLSATRVIGLPDSESGESDDLVSVFTYNTRGQLLTSTDPLGRVTRNRYDAAGLLVETTFAEGTPDEASIQFEYDAAGNVTAEIDEIGSRTEFEYDALNRLIGGTDAFGNSHVRRYDEAGNLTAVVDELDNESKLTYDAMDRLIQQTDAAGNSLTMTYDAFDNVIRQVDRLGRETEFNYDSRDRLVSVVNPLGDVSRTVYDAANNVVATQDTNGNVSRLVFDRSDRLVATIDALQGVRRFGYDPLGQKIFEIDELGRRKDLLHDEDNRLVEVQHPAPDGDEGSLRPIWRFEYDPAGNVVREIDSNGNVTDMEYDSRDRMIRTTTSDPDGDGPLARPVIEFRYDKRSLLVERIDPLGRVIATEYDRLNRPTVVSLPAPDGDGAVLGSVTTTVYDAVGNITSIVDPLGNVTEYEYDALYRQIETRSTDPDGEGPQQRPVSRTEYDAEGQIVAVIDPLGRTTRLEYDDLGRQRFVIEADPDGAGPLQSPITESIYDPFGNQIATIDARGNRTDRVFDALHRQVQVRSADPDGAGPLQRPIHTFEYDAASQLVATTDPLGRTTRSEFDGLGRIITVVQPDPDAAGPLESPVFQYEFDLRGNLLAEIDPLGNVTRHENDQLNRRTRTIFADPDGDGPLQSPTIQHVYDAANQLVATIDPLFRETTYGYDALGRQVRTIEPDPDGAGPAATPVKQLTYDLVGNLLSEIDALGNATSRTYDDLYRLVSVTEADPDDDGPLESPVYQYRYDVAGQMIETIDPLDRRTAYQYDDLGRRSAQLMPDPDGAGPLQRPEVRFRYDANDNRVATINALGNETLYEFDGLDRNTRIISADPDGNGPLQSPVTQFEYDAAGQLTATIDPLGRRIRFEFDDLGRTIRTTQADPDGDGPQQSPTLIRTYDPLDNVLSSSNALGHTTTYQYDNLYRLTEEQDAAGGMTRFDYDINGRRTSLTDPVGNTTRWQYDGLDRVIVTIDPVGESTFFRHDAEDNLIETVDRLGRVTRNTYDNLYRKTTETWLQDDQVLHTFEYEFDAADQLLSAEDVFASYDYGYDDLGRKTRELISIASLGVDVEHLHGYDIENRPTSKATSIGGAGDFVNRYTHDDLNRVTGILQEALGDRSVATKRIDITFDIASQPQLVTRFADASGTLEVAQSLYQFDDTSRLIGLDHVDDDAVLASHQWTFDAANRIIQYDNATDGTATYTHDDRDQLLESQFANQDNQQYEYDDNGNRTGGGNVVDANNLIQSDGVFDYEYDAENNRIRRVEIATGDETRYTWDHRNRLTQVTNIAANGIVTQTVDHIYDVWNRWIGTTAELDGQGPQDSTTEHYVYNDQQIVLAFESGELTHRYLWGVAVDQLLADEQVDLDAGGDVLWPLTDHQSTIQDLVRFDSDNQTTSVVNHIQYDAFGNVVSQTEASVDTLFGFTGRPFDQATALQNNLNRWYDSVTGRWISEDPIGFDAADANQNRYVGNSPTSKIDPDGLELGDSFFLAPKEVPIKLDANGLPPAIPLKKSAGELARAAQAAKAARAAEIAAINATAARNRSELKRIVEQATRTTKEVLKKTPATSPLGRDVIFGRELAKAHGVKNVIPESVARDLARAGGRGTASNIANNARRAISEHARVTRAINDGFAARRSIGGRVAEGALNVAEKGVNVAKSAGSKIVGVVGKVASVAGAGINFVKSIPFAGKIIGGVISAPAQTIIGVTDLATSLAGYIYVSEQKEATAEEFRQHQENLERLAVDLYNQKIREQNAIVRAKNEKILDEIAERRQRERLIEREQDKNIILQALREREFIEAQQDKRRIERENRATTGVPPVDFGNFNGAEADNEREEAPPAPGPSVSTTGGGSFSDRLRSTFGRFDSTPTINSQDVRKSACPPDEEER